MRMFSCQYDKEKQDEIRYAEELKQLDLKQLVKEFFTYLDYTETSDSGRVFHPVSFSCCRVMMTKPAGMVMDEMRRLSHAD